MRSQAVLEFLEEVEVVKPTDMVLRQIQGLISQGILRPGDDLPSERDLAERLAVGRGYVRDALKRLEFYGVIEVRPNRRPKVADLGIRTLDSQISNVLRLDEADAQALMEARAVLEIQAACLAAERATKEECALLEETLVEHAVLLQEGTATMEVDFLFHAQVAQFSHNPMLLSLITRLVPALFRQSRQFDTCGGLRSGASLVEHRKIAEGIFNRNPEEARSAMEFHMRKTCEIFNARMF